MQCTYIFVWSMQHFDVWVLSVRDFKMLVTELIDTVFWKEFIIRNYYIQRELIFIFLSSAGKMRWRTNYNFCCNVVNWRIICLHKRFWLIWLALGFSGPKWKSSVSFTPIFIDMFQPDPHLFKLIIKTIITGSKTLI